MRFVTPQFIDIEPKIIGPITARQFIILVLGGGLVFICYKIFDTIIFALVSLFIVAPIILAFAFIKFNGRPFHYFLLSIIQSSRRPSLRVWRKEIIIEKEMDLKKKEAPKEEMAVRKNLPLKKLSRLSLQVDTGGKFNVEEGS
ncbi:MAG: PrgI family protein [Ignavibacterium sp.]|nr:PrgI family protein [Ignavibacterium sp.]